MKTPRRILSLLKNMHAAGKLTAAVCAAPTVLAEAGLLEDKRATSHPGHADILSCGEYSTDSVVRDGTIITSRGLGTSIDFALEIISYLDSEASASEIRKKIVYL